MCGGLNLPGNNAIVVLSCSSSNEARYLPKLVSVNVLFTLSNDFCLLSPLGVPTSPLLIDTIELKMPLMRFFERGFFTLDDISFNRSSKLPSIL